MNLKIPTFIGAWEHFVLGICVLEDALGAEHVVVIFAEEFYLLVLVDFAKGYIWFLLATATTYWRGR